jgi:glycosyltransferase involved in cell wall biosynthesis
MTNIQTSTYCGGLRTHNSDEKSSLPGKPLVSIVTVVWNAEALLERTIESVLLQTYENIEFIVIDGGSSDGTLDLLLRYDTKIDYWISEHDHGIYDAMNKGISLCRGDLVGIIGAGDWYEQDAVTHIVETYLRTQADVVYGDVELVDGETGIGCKRESRAELMPKTMTSISHPSTFTRLDIYREISFDTSFRIAADYDLFLHLYINERRFESSNKLIAHILSGGVSGSWTTIVEVYRVHLKNYGVVYALVIFIPTMLRYSFFETRQWVLKKMLTPKYYASLRAFWLQYKSGKFRH